MALIIGTGMDVVDIRRIEKTLARFGDRFVRRCFTEIERERSDRRMRRAESYAKRYAAKEAGAKALGTGLARGVAWRTGPPGPSAEDRFDADRRISICSGARDHQRRAGYLGARRE